MMKISLPITQAQIDACRSTNLEALVHAIRDAGRSHSPLDGSVGKIMATLDALDRIEALVVEPVVPAVDGLPLAVKERLVENYKASAVIKGQVIPDEVDVGATEKGERVTVKKRVIER